jgi:pimeloyl-ACP methyl ester carboxylesterase
MSFMRQHSAMSKLSKAPPIRRTRVAVTVATAAVILLPACGTVPAPYAEAAPRPLDCPRQLPAGTRCLGGRDSAGAHVLIAVPPDWNGHLVMHAHGGPLLGEPQFERAVEDLQRWAVTVKAGYAWAGSTFAQGGVQVRAAGDDTERLRRIFVAHVGIPKRTLLHGQSWGAGVAAKLAERAPQSYDGVLLTSGVLAGGTRSYDFRLDLRVVYQYLCGNHPRQDEPAYPLWMGLPKDSKMTRAELAERARECLGLGLPAAQRSAEQARRLKTVVDVIRIPERSVQGHLNWATFHFADIAHQRSGGRPVFGNAGVRYSASADDAALNAAVLRYAPDPDAVRRFGDDTDPTGRIDRPVLTVHARQDPVAFVELSGEFGRTMARAGRAANLVQVYTDHGEHSYLSDPVYAALLGALIEWVDGGRRPDPAAFAARCEVLRESFPGDCRVLPDWQPPPLSQRVPPRHTHP